MADNVYYSKNCPAKMQDGRFLTDWNPRTLVDSVGMAQTNSTSEHDYRKKLQSSAESIIHNLQTVYVTQHTCHCSEPCKLNS